MMRNVFLLLLLCCGQALAAVCVTDDITSGCSPAIDLSAPGGCTFYEVIGNSEVQCELPDKYKDQHGRYKLDSAGRPILGGGHAPAGDGGSQTPPVSGGGQSCYKSHYTEPASPSGGVNERACYYGGWPRVHYSADGSFVGCTAAQFPKIPCDSKPSPDSGPEAPNSGQCVSFQGKFYRSPAAACAIVGLSFEGHHVSGREYRCGKGSGYQVFFVDCPNEDKPKDGEDGKDGQDGEKGEKGEDGKDAEGGGTVNNTTNNTTNNNTTNVNQGGQGQGETTDFCKANPRSLACLQGGNGEVGEITVPRKTEGGRWGGDFFLPRTASATCPADKTITVLGSPLTLSYASACRFLDGINPFVIALCMFLAGGMVINSLRSK